MTFILHLLSYFDLRVRSMSAYLDDQSTRGGGNVPESADLTEKRGSSWWNLLTYVFIVFGVVGKFIFDYWQQTRPITWMDLGISFVIGGLVFPAIYKSTKLSPDKPDEVLQYFLAFQNGFFWQTLIGGLLH